jgi:probable rRNA maturation factor
MNQIRRITKIMDKLKVVIENRQTVIKPPVGLRLLIRRSCAAVLNYENFAGSAEVSVSFMNDEQIRELNAQYRKKDIATDVLSFPITENGKYEINPDTNAAILGDIVISLERAAVQSEIYGHSFSREVSFLVVHSMLHLLGYDHENGGLEALAMREKEEVILNALGMTRGAIH